MRSHATLGTRSRSSNPVNFVLMEDDEFTHHPLGELANAIFTFLLSQRFLFPFVDQGRIFDLFPPIRFLPDRVRKSAHPHFEDLTPAWFSSRITKVTERQKETSPFLGVPGCGL